MVLDLLRRLAEPGIPIRVNGLIGEAKTPDGEWKVAKFWITNDLALVYVDEAGTPKLVASADIEGFTAPHTEYTDQGPVEHRHYAVQTVAGEEWSLTPTGHCGCGSSLPGFSPFPPPSRIGD